MIDFTMECGRDVEVRGVLIDRTYETLLEGAPSREINEAIMADHRRLLGNMWGAPMLVLDAAGDPMDVDGRPLPLLRYSACLLSNDPANDPARMGSHLVVVWFEDSYHPPDRGYLAGRLARINWRQWARDFDW